MKIELYRFVCNGSWQWSICDSPQLKMFLIMMRKPDFHEKMVLEKYHDWRKIFRSTWLFSSDFFWHLCYSWFRILWGFQSRIAAFCYHLYWNNINLVTTRYYFLSQKVGFLPTSPSKVWEISFPVTFFYKQTKQFAGCVFPAITKHTETPKTISLWPTDSFPRCDVAITYIIH